MFIEVTENNRKEERLINCNYIVDILEESSTKARIYLIDETSVLLENTYNEIKDRLIGANMFIAHKTF